LLARCPPFLTPPPPRAEPEETQRVSVRPVVRQGTGGIEVGIGLR
jgi:hypothetical protein